MRSEQIEAFIAAAEESSFAGAGRRLSAHRSTLSAAVAALEDDLNVQLFTRSGNRLTLTPIGESILADCQRLLASAQLIRQRCAQHSQGVENKLRIARDDALPEFIWLRALQRLQQKYPLTATEVYLVPRQEHATFISLETVDLAFGLGPPSPQSEPLSPIPQVLVAAPGHALSRLPVVEEDDLRQSREICLTYLAQGRLVATPLYSSNYTAMTSYELIRDAVEDGQGWAVLPAVLVQDALKQKRLVDIHHTQALPAINYQVRHRGKPGPVALSLQNLIQSAIKQLES